MSYQSSRSSFWKTPWGIAATLAAIAASGYLYFEHKAHVYALLPYLILSACLLMHVFMHRGHAHGGHGQAKHQHEQDHEARPGG